MLPATTSNDVQDIIEIRDPEIDVQDIMRRIQETMGTRRKLAPLAAALGRGQRFEERQKLLKAIDGVKERINTFGTVATLRGGWLSKIELAGKQFIRKLIGRHVLQQQQINEALLALVYQLMRYLDAQDRHLRGRFEAVQGIGQANPSGQEADHPR